LHLALIARGTHDRPHPRNPGTADCGLPTAAQRLPWLERLSKYRQPIGLALTLVLFTMGLIACRHLLSELDIYALHDAMLSVPSNALLGACWRPQSAS
jgi:phosphatidylglycerol lysyltransferase